MTRSLIARALVKRADLVLLDEPLANLDYKLREELREELPRVFAASGGIFVYATTEPTEALLLGGNTATLSPGELTQFGPTPQVYRQPHDLITAQVFSDPPLNLLTARKTGDVVGLSTGGRGAGRRRIRGRAGRGISRRLPGPSPQARTARKRRADDPGHRLGVRDHRIGDLLHVDAGERRFVALVPGVKRLEPGAR